MRQQCVKSVEAGVTEMHGSNSGLRMRRQGGRVSSDKGRTNSSTLSFFFIKDQLCSAGFAMFSGFC